MSTVQKPQIVVPDVGGWISGPCISFDEVCAAEVRTGDRLLLDDGIVAVVKSFQHGVYWVPDDFGGTVLASGVRIEWNQDEGNASGVLIRTPGALLNRVRPGR